jgi:hypothetical protein
MKHRNQVNLIHVYGKNGKGKNVLRRHRPFEDLFSFFTFTLYQSLLREVVFLSEKNKIEGGQGFGSHRRIRGRRNGAHFGTGGRILSDLPDQMEG